VVAVRYDCRIVSSENIPRTVHTDDAPKAIGPYSQAVVAHGFVFCSGQIALDPATGQIVEGGVREQTTRVMNNLRAVLEAAGTSFDRAVKTTIFLKDMGDFAVVNEVYGAFFAGGRVPARATVEVSRLPRDVRVEIDMVAMV
jgi:2-iminobutanoate/2-iminopropanoate deaminase